MVDPAAKLGFSMNRTHKSDARRRQEENGRPIFTLQRCTERSAVYASAVLAWRQQQFGR